MILVHISKVHALLRLDLTVHESFYGRVGGTDSVSFSSFFLQVALPVDTGSSLLLLFPLFPCPSQTPTTSLLLL
jgi:hypothetical protein